MSYDPRITARKAAGTAWDTARATAVLGAALGIGWALLEWSGHAVPESVREAVTPERIILLGSALATSPIIAGAGKAWRNWRKHRRSH